jgi:hypothetical protein
MNFKKLIYFFFQLNLVVLYAQDFVHPIYQNHIIVDGENFEYITNDHLYKLNPKTKSLDSISIEITQKIGTFKLIKNSEYFLVNSLGGELLHLNENKTERIDHSFSHKNQLKSSLFTFQNTLYRFGGYGFFDSRNFFTYFSNETNEWEALETKSKVFPPGLFDNKFFIHNNNFYVFGGYSIDINNRSKRNSNDELWKFSLDDKKWKLVTKNSIFNDLNFSNFDFLYDDSFYFLKNGELLSLDFRYLNLKNYGKLNYLDKGNIIYPTIVFDNTLFTIGNSPNSELSRKNIFELNLEEINVVSSTKLGLYTLGSIDYIVLIIIVISLLYFLIRKFLSRPKNIRLIKEKMIYGFKRIELSELEKSFLNLFLNNNALENIELVNLIGSEIDASQKSRIKNSTIESLNLKISLITNYKFQIKKYPSSSDRRYYSYKLLKNF